MKALVSLMLVLTVIFGSQHTHSRPLIIVNDFFYPDNALSHGNLMRTVITKRLSDAGYHKDSDYDLISTSYVQTSSGKIEPYSIHTYLGNEKINLIRYVRKLTVKGRENIIVNMSYVDSASLHDYYKRRQIYRINKHIYELSRDVIINKASGNNHYKEYMRDRLHRATQKHGLPAGFEQTMARLFLKHLDTDNLSTIITASLREVRSLTQKDIPIQYVNDIFDIFLREYIIFGQTIEFHRAFQAVQNVEDHHFHMIYSVRNEDREPRLGIYGSFKLYNPHGPQTALSNYIQTNQPFFHYPTPFDTYSEDHFIVEVEGKEVLLEGTSAATALKTADDAIAIIKKSRKKRLLR